MLTGNAAVVVRPVQVIGGIGVRRNDFKQVVTALAAFGEAAALNAATDDAAAEAAEELLTLLAELPEQEASSRAAADAPAACKNWRREILFFIRNTPLSM